jgi:cysteine desulfurase
MMIYLDHNATTPLAPEVRESMLPFMESEFGNPSSAYELGLHARNAVEKARKQLAELIHADPSEIVFTSGGTEGNNHVIKAMADMTAGQPGHIITTKIEHPAVIEPVLYLMNYRGWDATFVPVDGEGVVDPREVEKAINPRTRLISVMHANNETGVIQPVEEIGTIARRAGVLFHTDAAQGVGKIPIDVRSMKADFLTVAGHKLYAPKGVGALFIRSGVQLPPFLHGAGQENGRRAGTENVILIAGFGQACRLAHRNLDFIMSHLQRVTNRLYLKLKEAVPEIILFGSHHERLPNTLYLSFPGVSGAEVLAGAPVVCASTGAACHDRTVRMSHVLEAMGINPEIAMGAVRLTTGRGNTEEEMDRAAQALAESYRRIIRGRR